MSETLETLRRFIEHAPPTNPHADNTPDLRGFRCGPDEIDICRDCAGRIMARGCHLPQPSDPIWQDSINTRKPYLPCALCTPAEPADLSAEELWTRIIGLLNNGNETDDGLEMRTHCDDLIRTMEGTSPFPRNAVIKPGLTRQGFINLLYLINAGAYPGDGTDDTGKCVTCGRSPAAE